jgi:PIN domain nuclease of toxin-antitoxin system
LKAPKTRRSSASGTQPTGLLWEIQIKVKLGKLVLISQAVEESLTLVSVDPLMHDYPVAVLG